jgi:hypothetical protein
VEKFGAGDKKGNPVERVFLLTPQWLTLIFTIWRDAWNAFGPVKIERGRG